MDQPIILRFRWTADELLRARGYHFRHACRPVFRVALHFIFALMILAGWILLQQGGSSLALGVALLAAGVYGLALRRFERRWMARRGFRKRPDQDIEIEWQIAGDRLFTRSSLGQSELEWQAFSKMVRTPAGLLLYSTDEIFHWLPRTGFASDADFEKCAALAKSKIGRHHDAA